MHNSRAAVLVAAPYPPPVHGFAVIMSAMANVIEQQASVVRVDLAAERGSRIATHMAQIWRCLAGCVAILRHRLRGGRVSAIGVNGGLGQIYTIALTLTARSCGQQIMLHHHSYLYINRHSKMMMILLAITGTEAIHVFLSETMAGAFRTRYRCEIRHDILNNAMFVPASNMPRTKNQRPVAGLLSNLSYEKGLHDFLALAHRAKSEGINMDFVLAGPAKLEEDRTLIERAVIAGEVTWHGPLYGDAKQAFYAGIDLLVFPTRYEFEAQPTIIYEAFAVGTPALSIDRGTIREQLQDCLMAITADEDFVETSIPVLQRIAVMDEVGRKNLSDRAKSLHAESTRAGQETIQRLFWAG